MTTKMEKKMIGQFYALTEENGKLKVRIEELETSLDEAEALTKRNVDQLIIGYLRIADLDAQITALKRIAIEEHQEAFR